jgi:small-conductance mechanosensitive channel
MAHATGGPMAAAAVTKKAMKKSIVKGKLSGFVAKFLISPQQAWHIVQRLVVFIQKDFWDLVLIVSIYRCIVPLAQKVYQRNNPQLDANSDKFTTLFLRSKTHRMARAVKEVAFLLGLLFAFDIGLLLLEELKFDFVKHYPLHEWTAGIVASLWGSRNLSEFKDFVLTRGNRIDLYQSPGRRLLSRFLNLLIYGSTLLVILDFLSVQTGFALKSLFGLSSIGTLVFSLASKELVSEFLASLAIQGTNMYTGTCCVESAVVVWLFIHIHMFPWIGQEGY